MGYCVLQHSTPLHYSKVVHQRLTKTPDAPSARALKTSEPRRMPPSKNTGTRPLTAYTTCFPEPQLPTTKTELCRVLEELTVVIHNVPHSPRRIECGHSGNSNRFKSFAEKNIGNWQHRMIMYAFRETGDSWIQEKSFRLGRRRVEQPLQEQILWPVHGQVVEPHGWIL